MAYLITSRGSGKVPKTLSLAIIYRRPVKNKEEIKIMVDRIKELIRKENDPEWINCLAVAGLSLNNLLVKDNG